MYRGRGGRGMGRGTRTERKNDGGGMRGGHSTPMYPWKGDEDNFPSYDEEHSASYSLSDLTFDQHRYLSAQLRLYNQYIPSNAPD